MLDSISVVICTRNVLTLLEDNLAILCEGLKGAEFIVIDGNSTDGTKEFASKFVSTVLSDGGQGLAAARQMGAEAATRPYVIFAGSDNRISAATATKMAQVLSSDPKLAAVGVQTKVVDAKTYWEKTTERFFHYFINRVGRASIVGTPSMYKREVLITLPFDRTVKSADDTDVAYRLAQAGYEFEVVDAYVEEKIELPFSAFVKRWSTQYGRSDAEFYAKNEKNWSIGRRLQSLTHPLRKYALHGAWTFLINGEALYIPGLWVATIARYQGWIKAAGSGQYASHQS